MLILWLFSFASCNKENAPDIIQTTGEEIISTRQLDAFFSIEISDNIDVTLIQDSINYVNIAAGKNLIPDISTEVIAEKLSIKNLNNYNFVRSYKHSIHVFLHYKHISQISYKGSGSIDTENTIKDSVLYFDCYNGTGSVNLQLNVHESHFNMHTGQCDLTLSGEVGLNYLYQAGNGFSNAERLETGYTFITNNSTNDARINVSKVLYAKINYLGNVYYKGDAYDISTDITDQGQLIKIN